MADEHLRIIQNIDEYDHTYTDECDEFDETDEGMTGSKGNKSQIVDRC
jgi:hypothetical protein